MWTNWQNGNHHAHGPMARWPGLLCYQLWPGPRFWAVTSTCMAQCVLLKTRVLNVSTESCWSMLKILIIFHVEKRIPMLIVECRDSCQSWQWRLSFRTLIRLGPLWWTNSHWENLAPWLAPVCHRHPYTAPVHSIHSREQNQGHSTFAYTPTVLTLLEGPTLMFRLCLAFCCRKSLYISNLRSISLYEYSAYKNLVRWSLSSP